MIQQSSSSRKCNPHNLDCVAINLEPQCEIDYRILCAECLTKHNKCVKISIKDAQNEFIIKSQQFKQQMEEQAKQNIEIFKDLSSNLDEFQNQIIKQIEKLQSIIKQSIEEVQNEQKNNIENLQSLNVFDFYSQAYELKKSDSIYTQIRKLIEQELLSFSRQERIEQCQKLLNDLNESQGFLKYDESQVYIQRYIADDFDTPHLNLICQEHKKEIILFDITTSEKSKENRIACVTCISGQVGPYTELLKVQELWKEYECCQNDILSYNDKLFQKKKGTTLQSFRSMREKINQSINGVENDLIKLEINLSEIQFQFNPDWYFLQREQVLKIADTLSQPQRKYIFECEANDKYNESENQLNIITRNSILNLKETVEQCVQNINDCYEKIVVDPQIINSINIKFKKQKIKQIHQIQRYYVMVQQNYNQIEEDRCFAIAFDSQQTIMAAAFWSVIKLFSFTNGQISFIESIKIQGIKSLLFNKKSNKLICGGTENYISIWAWRKRNKNMKWCHSQTLQEHSDSINQVIMNESEKLMISCSKDCTIKFWTFNEDCECFQTLKAHEDQVLCMSLNESGRILVSCGDDKKIVISSQQENNRWSIEQVIKGWGFRICFIGDNYIAFQPVNSRRMKIFKYNDDKYLQQINGLQLSKGKKCRMYFPMIFNQQQQILVNKNGRIVNIIRLNNKQQFKVELTIEYKIARGYLFGALTGDGEYLVTFDFQSSKFKVIKFEYC